MLTKMITISLISVTWVISPPPVQGRANGSPPEACDSLVPAHGSSPQTTPSPYKISLDKVTVSPGDNIVLTINGGDKKFKGFLAQGRKVGETTPIGTFSSTSGTEAKTLKCHHESSSITHTNSKEKSSITLTWVAPSEKGKYNIL